MKLKETVILRLINKLGNLTYKLNKKQDLEKHNAFMVAQSGDIMRGKIVYVKATYEIVSELYVMFFNRRAHLFWYINTVIDKGYAPFTESIAGRNKSEKADTLYQQLKSAYCTINVCAPFSLADDAVGDKKPLSYADAMDRCVWMINNLFDAHRAITGKAGEAWAVEPWSEDL